jgi:type IV secretory pathway VirD2 relaxase
VAGKEIAVKKYVVRLSAEARMFDAAWNDADKKAFAERCEEDRHHFRFTVSQRMQAGWPTFVASLGN